MAAALIGALGEERGVLKGWAAAVDVVGGGVVRGSGRGEGRKGVEEKDLKWGVDEVREVRRRQRRQIILMVGEE